MEDKAPGKLRIGWREKKIPNSKFLKGEQEINRQMERRLIHYVSLKLRGRVNHRVKLNALRKAVQVLASRLQ